MRSTTGTYNLNRDSYCLQKIHLVKKHEKVYSRFLAVYLKLLRNYRITGEETFSVKFYFYRVVILTWCPWEFPPPLENVSSFPYRPFPPTFSSHNLPRSLGCKIVKHARNMLKPLYQVGRKNMWIWIWLRILPNKSKFN